MATATTLSSAAHAVRHGYAHLISIRGAAVKKKPVRARSEPTNDPAPFAHLRPAPGALAYYHDEPAAIEVPKVPKPLTAGELAAAILAAGAKSRTATGTGVAPPSGLAARIIAAGEKRRGLS